MISNSNQTLVMMPDPSNHTDDFDPYPDFTQIPLIRFLFITAYLLVMVLSVVGNAVVCVTVFTNRKMHTAVNYYIVNLAVCDFMVGIFVLPVKLLELTSPAHWGLLNDGLCTAMMYLQTIFVFASVLTLVAICIERYVAVVHPLESRTHQSKTRAKRILFAAWVVPCTVACPFLYPSTALANTLTSHYGVMSRLTCFIGLPETFRRGYYTFLFIFLYLVPLAFITVTCLRVARVLLKAIPVHRQGSIRRQEANRRKVAKMVLMVVAAFGLAWTPYFLVSIITQYQEVNFMEKENFFFTMLLINLFAFTNSCLNPFIYAAMSTRFRNGFRRCFRLLCLCGGKDVTPGQKKKVRFQCRTPVSCLLTQSSSEGTSNASHSFKTAYTVEQTHIKHSAFVLPFHSNRRRRRSRHFKKNPESNGAVHLSNMGAVTQIVASNLSSSVINLKFSKKNSVSDGNLSLFLDLNELSPLPKRWSSCLTLKSDNKDISTEFEEPTRDSSNLSTSVIIVESQKKYCSALDIKDGL